MERRFAFITPTEGELKLSEQGKLMLPLAAVAVIALNMVHWPSAFFKLGFGLLLCVTAVWLIVRLTDIQRRETQAKYGFVEVTPRELRVSLSEGSLLRVQWPNFQGTELKNGWLRFQYRDAQIEQGGYNKRLDRVRIAEIENSDALLDALRAQTAFPA